MKRLFIATALTAALLTSFASTEVFAKGQPTPHERYVQKCNQQAHAAARGFSANFERIDANHDRLLEAAETRVVGMSDRCKERCVKHLDRNRDGVLSVSEIGHTA